MYTKNIEKLIGKTITKVFYTKYGKTKCVIGFEAINKQGFISVYGIEGYIYSPLEGEISKWNFSDAPDLSRDFFGLGKFYILSKDENNKFIEDEEFSSDLIWEEYELKENDKE